MPDREELHRGWVESLMSGKVKPGKIEDWNTEEDVPATHFDGSTEKEIKAANERADAVKKERGRELCEDALRVINGGRQNAYGKPEDSFFRIACLWSSYLGREVEGSDVANMMILLKMAREKEGKGKRDNYVDIVGYAALGANLRGYEDEA